MENLLTQTKKTHGVIDMTYHEDDEGGNMVMVGSLEECEHFIFTQNTIGLKTVTLTKEEILEHNREM